MLRLIHSQVGQGALLVDDIDDQLPNKVAHRLGGTGDPKAYKRDGYANSPKQKCYIPRVKAGEPTIPGFIDLNQTERVTNSAGRGKIAGLQRAGLISVVSFSASDLATPTVASATLDAPAVGDVTIAGTNFLSLTPDITSVRLFGAGVGDVTLTSTQIVAVAPGSVTNTTIVIDSTLVPGLSLGDLVTVRADGQTSTPPVAVT